MDKVPDELLKEILQPPLLVPDAMFASTAEVSPFSKVTYSASTVLLVCKRWMRIATPTLYATVVIRSTAQAHALSMALTRNPQFGLYVRKLRLEGIYHEWLTPKLFRAMPKVVDFCFTLSVSAADKLAGMQAAFTTFDLRRVVVSECQRGRHNKTRERLVAELSHVIARSKNLKHVTLSSGSGDTHFEPGGNLALALAQSTSLETVECFCPPMHWRMHLDMHQIGRTLRGILKNRSVKVVQLYIPESMEHSDFDPIDDRVHVIAGGRVVRGPLLSFANPFVRPMELVPEDVRLEIWTRIIRLAAIKHEIAADEEFAPHAIEDTWGDHRQTFRRYSWSREPKYFYEDKYDIPCAARLNLVSREFYRATMTALSTDVRLRSPLSFILLSTTRSHAVSVIQKLDLDMASLSLIANGPEILAEMLQLRELHLSPSGNGRDLLGCIPAPVRQNLRILCVCKRGQEDALWAHDLAESFRDLHQLRRLQWEHASVFFERDTALHAADLLPALEELYVEEAHSSVWAALARCSLPSLTRVAIKRKVRAAEQFLKAHGSKLTQLAVTVGLRQADMNIMSNLRYLRLYTDIFPSHILAVENATVETMQLNWSCFGTYAQKFGSLDIPKLASNYPALRTIIVRWSDSPEANLWPTNERDEKKSPWPQLAANFEKHGIKLVNNKRRGWRERLRLDVQVEDIPRG